MKYRDGDILLKKASSDINTRKLDEKNWAQVQEVYRVDHWDIDCAYITMLADPLDFDELDEHFILMQRGKE